MRLISCCGWLLGLMLMLSMAGQAATIASWTDSALNVNSSVNAAVGSGVLTRGTVTYANTANVYNSTNWDTTPDATTALANSKYAQLTLDTTGYYGVQLSFRHLRDGNGPRNVRVFVSTNGTIGPFTDVSGALSNGTSAVLRSVSLSVLSGTSNNANVVVRLVAYQALTTGGSTGFYTLGATGDPLPTLALPGPNPITWTEGDAPLRIDSTTTLSSGATLDYTGGHLAAKFASGGLAEDRLVIVNEGTGAGQISVSGNEVSYEGLLIGTYGGGVGGADLITTFTTGDSTPVVVEALFRAIAYTNASDTPTTAPRTVAFLLDDSFGGVSNQPTKTINVVQVNHAPTAVGVNPSAVNENEAGGTVVGTLQTTDPDNPADAQTFTYTLVSGAGSTNNGLFAISGGQLLTAASFDFETTSSYSIRVRATDNGSPALSFEQALTISVNNVNETPTALNLSANAIDENVANGTVIGNFSSTDPDNPGAGQTFTYTLVAGTGGTDNAAFAISGNQLQTAAAINYEAQAGYSIRMRTTDSGSPAQTFDQVFTINVSNVNEAPTALNLSANVINENATSGTAIGNFSATDPDNPGAGQTFTYTLVSGTGGTDNAQFAIVGNEVRSAAVFDYETKANYSIRVRVTDSGSPTQTFDQVFTINVSNVNEAPTALNLSANAINENVASGTAIGSLSTTDPDNPGAGQTFTYTLVSGTGGTDNAQFAIVGNEVRSAAVFDYETKANYSIRVRVTDSGSLAQTFDQVFTINVNNANEAPTAITLSGTTVTENVAAGTLIGTLSATDPDNPGAAQTFTYAFAPGGRDNACFALAANQLLTSATLDYETTTSYHVRLRATDSGTGNLSLDQDATITVVNVNEPPTLAVPGAQQTVAGRSLPLAGIVLGDPDAGAVATLDLTLTATLGRVTLGALGTATIVAGANNSGAVTLRGTLATLQGAVAGLTFTADAAGAGELALGLDDRGNSGLGGAQSAAAAVAISIAERSAAGGWSGYE
jgi:hypothetical protein